MKKRCLFCLALLSGGVRHISPCSGNHSTFRGVGNTTYRSPPRGIGKHPGNGSAGNEILPDDSDPVVYMTADISPEGLMAVYAALGQSCRRAI